MSADEERERSGEEYEGDSWSDENSPVLAFEDGGASLRVRSGTTSAELEQALAQREEEDPEFDRDAALDALTMLDVRDCALTDFSFLDKCCRLAALNMCSNGT